MINFASDNASGVHPRVIEKLAEVNSGAVSSYGNDKYTEMAVSEFKKRFGDTAKVLFAFNGTGANTIALGSLARSFNMVLSSPLAHIAEDECGAPVKFSGTPIRFVNDKVCKVKPENITPFMPLVGDVHKSQPKVVSISQANEVGEVYNVKELENLSDFCRKNNFYIHMDGARISNAAAKLNAPLKDAAKGADILCFGGTKNGLMGAEALVVLNPDVADVVPFMRKQAAQLASKMRYISAQFLAFFENDLWLDNAKNANNLLQSLYSQIKDLSYIKVMYPADINMIFVEMPNKLIDRLLEKFYFYTLSRGEKNSVVRLMTSWQTTEDEVNMFAEAIKKF